MPRIAGQIQDGPHIDFCILGASKSGKTGLAAYLRTHPRIFLPSTEPNFYADDIAQYAPMPRPKTRQAYRELFAGAAEGQLLGEVSGLYLSSERAVPNILRDSPDARFIVMLRNPVEIAHSAHSNLLRSQFEDERSFQKAWELQEARAAGEQIPRLCKEPKLLLYRQRSSFASQMERFLQWLPRERVLVHIFEEFFADPNAGYERTLTFLGLPRDSRTHFERVSEHGVPRSWRLHRLALDPPFPLNRLYGPLKTAFYAFGLRPGAAILRGNIGKEEFSAIDPSFRRQLDAEFRPDVERLEAILGRNLDIWKSE